MFYLKGFQSLNRKRNLMKHLNETIMKHQLNLLSTNRHWMTILQNKKNCNWQTGDLHTIDKKQFSAHLGKFVGIFTLQSLTDARCVSKLIFKCKNTPSHEAVFQFYSTGKILFILKRFAIPELPPEISLLIPFITFFFLKYFVSFYSFRISIVSLKKFRRNW